ncbi:hypothetical protein [Rhodophyticola porphyridii]|uniref:hypothetical protein n=1 Tax=Rhodophyticola porphyridii TaxID=1852017 RepID=UPI0035CEBA2A
MTNEPKSEFEAFQQIHEALVDLDEDARGRVISSVATLLGIGTVAATSATRDHPKNDNVGRPDEEAADEEIEEAEFSEFAELYAAARPNSNAEKALVAGYWLQICEGADSITAQGLNAELNHLGHKLTHVTDAMSQLISEKPQLVLQLRKSGKTKQARKTYKLSAEGIKRVRGMTGAA